MSLQRKYERLREDIHRVYSFCQSNPVPNAPQLESTHMADPNSELASILAYAQASAGYITAAAALIAQLKAASSSNPAPTDSDSPDVETAIQNILAFQTANPVPAVPTAVTPTPAAPAASS